MQDNKQEQLIQLYYTIYSTIPPLPPSPFITHTHSKTPKTNKNTTLFAHKVRKLTILAYFCARQTTQE